MLFLARLLWLCPGIVSLVVAGILILVVFVIAGDLQLVQDIKDRLAEIFTFSSVADVLGQGR